MKLSKKKLIVANTGSDSLTTINLINNEKHETIPLGSLVRKFKNKNVYINGSRIGPHHIIPCGEDLLYTVNSYHNSLFRIDMKSKELQDMVYVGSSPSHLAIYNRLLFVTNSDSNSVSVIDKDKFSLVANVPVGEKPHDIKVDYHKNCIYVANSDGHSIQVIDLKDLKDREIRIDSNPLHLIVSNNKIYILSSQGNGIQKSSISVLDIEKEVITDRITIMGTLMDMAVIDPYGWAYTTNADDGCLYKVSIKENKILKKYFFGGMPNIILWDREDLLYVTNAIKKTLMIFSISEERVIHHMTVENEPYDMVFI